MWKEWDEQPKAGLATQLFQADEPLDRVKQAFVYTLTI